MWQTGETYWVVKVRAPYERGWQWLGDFSGLGAYDEAKQRGCSYAQSNPTHEVTIVMMRGLGRVDQEHIQ